MSEIIVKLGCMEKEWKKYELKYHGFILCKHGLMDVVSYTRQRIGWIRRVYSERKPGNHEECEESVYE